MKINNPITGAAMLASEDNGVTLHCAITGRLFYIFDDAEQVYLSAITGRVYAIKSENKLIDPVTGVTLGIYNEDGSILSSAITGRELAIIEGGDPPVTDAVAYWQFDTDFADASGNGYDLTMVQGSVAINNTVFAAGGGSLECAYSAPSGYLELTGSETMEDFNLQGKDFTLECFICAKNDNDMSGSILMKHVFRQMSSATTTAWGFEINYLQNPSVRIGGVVYPVDFQVSDKTKWWKLAYVYSAADETVDVFAGRTVGGNEPLAYVGTINNIIFGKVDTAVVTVGGTIGAAYGRFNMFNGFIDELKLTFAKLYTKPEGV